jgi:hypothetical protein
VLIFATHIPQSRRPDFGRCIRQKLDVAVRKRVSDKPDEITQRIRLAIGRSLLRNRWPAYKAGGRKRHGG